MPIQVNYSLDLGFQFVNSLPDNYSIIVKLGD